MPEMRSVLTEFVDNHLLSSDKLHVDLMSPVRCRVALRLFLFDRGKFPCVDSQVVFV